MTSILEKNLSALSVSSPRLAEVIRRTAAHPGIGFVQADDGAISGTLDGRAMCSRRRPLDEARKLAGTIDVGGAAAVVVCGFGMGHHVGAMLERMAKTGVVFVFEPDTALLRTVLERADHSSWLSARSLIFLTDAEDSGAIAESVRGCEGLLAMGVKFLEHAADRARLGELSARFQASFTAVYKAVRTTVVTTLMQSETTLRNLVMNLDHYATRPGIADLRDAARGRPAIVVSAGPSLRRNIDLLARPGVRERFVIIAVQTVLKQLLARGVRPHFVTALDHHEISRRFYEGLTESDVEGVTLVAEPKVNPAVLEAYPGRVRIPADWLPGSTCPALDELLGPGLSREMGRLPAGATVAHLAYYLARFMGCDPVILVGQDLGFTDGQYYAAGAAIHQVWSSELNEFRTLEMLEWERIVRGRSHLHRASDHLGRPVYTDEQMATYRVQFEREFKADAERGLCTIDATEGGVLKQGAEVMPLAGALARFGGGEPVAIPPAPAPLDAPARLRKLDERLASLRRDIWRIGDLSARGRGLLDQMLTHHGDHARVNALVAKVHAVGAEATAIQPAFGFVQRLNQTGTLKRAKADRAIAVEAGLSPLERQKRQIERDSMNLSWTEQAAARLGSMIEAVIACRAGAPRQTRDAEEETSATGPAKATRVVAVVALDAGTSGLGTVRDLAEPVFEGLNAAQLTLRRLGRCGSLDSIVVLSPDPERARAIIGPLGPGASIQFAPAVLPAGLRSVRAARLWAPACWRGALGNLSVYDEALLPEATLAVMERGGFDAAVVVGADWAAIDPALVDEAVARFRQRPGGEGAHRLTFCQAPPGAGACVIERSLVRELAEKAATAGVFASVGGLLGYVPIAPLADPIVKPVCVSVAPELRDCQLRLIPDSAERRSALRRALETTGPDAGAAAIAGAWRESSAAPRELILELCTGRRTGLPRGTEAPERPVLGLSTADAVLREFSRLRSDSTLTLAGAGDPVLHSELTRIVSLAKRAGVAGVHIRTDLQCDRARALELAACGADIISVNLSAETSATYRAVLGGDGFDRVRENLSALLGTRTGGLPFPWIVPRITRCDATYEDIEGFYDRWIMLAGAAVIDPLDEPRPGERIEPLPAPAQCRSRERMLVLSDGRVPASCSDASGERIAADIVSDGVAGAWRKLQMRSANRSVEPKPGLLHGVGSRSRVACLGAM